MPLIRGAQVTIRLAIILPTYNGANYLAEQLNSLAAQTSKNFVIVIRDDGSTDNTLDVIQSFQIKFPQLIHFVTSAENNLGASGSFSYLMRYVLEHKHELNLDSAYIMFCDQDDIWHEEKWPEKFP
jgi:glycosyltransferase involved in cell wall biosynthesis